MRSEEALAQYARDPRNYRRHLAEPDEPEQVVEQESDKQPVKKAKK
jgi:hypothetical protein